MFLMNCCNALLVWGNRRSWTSADLYSFKEGPVRVGVVFSAGDCWIWVFLCVWLWMWHLFGSLLSDICSVYCCVDQCPDSISSVIYLVHFSQCYTAKMVRLSRPSVCAHIKQQLHKGRMWTLDVQWTQKENWGLSLYHHYVVCVLVVNI